jgi:hypothetical protein
MQTNDVINQIPFTGHCMSDTCTGCFLMAARNGNLIAVSEIFEKRGRIAAKLERIERKLLSSKNPLAVSRYVRWCKTRKKDFNSEFRQLLEKLESEKQELALILQTIDESLALQNPGFGWTLTTTFVTLIPLTKPLDPAVAHRFSIIDQNLEKSGRALCKILDSSIPAGAYPPGFLPENWKEKYGVATWLAAYRHPECRPLVWRMFSSRKSNGP